MRKKLRGGVPGDITFKGVGEGEIFDSEGSYALLVRVSGGGKLKRSELLSNGEGGAIRNGARVRGWAGFQCTPLEF
jgi:hypothetical protein